MWMTPRWKLHRRWTTSELIVLNFAALFDPARYIRSRQDFWTPLAVEAVKVVQLRLGRHLRQRRTFAEHNSLDELDRARVRAGLRAVSGGDERNWPNDELDESELDDWERERQRDWTRAFEGLAVPHCDHGSEHRQHRCCAQHSRKSPLFNVTLAATVLLRHRN